MALRSAAYFATALLGAAGDMSSTESTTISLVSCSVNEGISAQESMNSEGVSSHGGAVRISFNSVIIYI